MLKVTRYIYFRGKKQLSTQASCSFLQVLQHWNNQSQGQQQRFDLDLSPGDTCPWPASSHSPKMPFIWKLQSEAEPGFECKLLLGDTDIETDS